MTFRFILPVILGLVTFANLTANENESTDGDWLEYYYLDPKPEEFVAKMKDWARDGTLRNQGAQPALIAFVSQLMRQNRDQIRFWWSDLQGLSPENSVVLRMGLLFSRTAEADEILSELTGKNPTEDSRPPKILDAPLGTTATIDMLWGFYYATGSENPIRRLLKCFIMEDAPKKPEGLKMPQGAVPYYTQLPRMAYVSLITNMERHPELVRICEEIYQAPEELHSTEKENLYDLLSEIKPDKYPVREELLREAESVE